MDNPPPPPPPMDDDNPPPPAPDDDEPPPPAPDDDGDVPPPPAPPSGSPKTGLILKPQSTVGAQSTSRVKIERSEPTHVESDFRILIREMKRLVGAEDSDESENPEPLRKCTWEAIYTDSYIDSYFGERLSSVMHAARKQKVVLFAPERMVRGEKRDAELTLLTYQIPKDLKGAGAYAKTVAKAEERAASNAKKADEMRKKLKDMKTTVGQLIEEVELVEEEEEDEDKGSDDDVPPPPPPPEDDEDDMPPPPPPEDDEDDAGPPPPPPDDDDDPPPPPPPDD